MEKRHVVILGGGPAGLTAAYELLQKGCYKVTVYELETQVGGISRTIVYKNNRMDIGGHRFFSKSDTVMDWWQKILPIQKAPASDEQDGKGKYPQPGSPDPERDDKVMLLRKRLSRILYLKKFFDYPITLSVATINKLGITRTIGIGFSYIQACLFPIRDEKNLEDFFINHFGRKLYETFFKDYTHKVWGVPCNRISKDWGAQRIKGLSIIRLLRHAVRQLFHKDSSIGQKGTETSLIEQFLYPKLGPGQLWEEVAGQVERMGGTVLLQHQVTGMRQEGRSITGVEVTNLVDGSREWVDCDHVISTLPIRELVAMLQEVPEDVRAVSEGLVYRDFITVGVLASAFSPRLIPAGDKLQDNWLYIQEPEVHMGRIQIFNNWSPYMVDDAKRVWIGLEYFANEGDALWSMTDDAFMQMAVRELDQIGMVETGDVLDTTILRVKKAYPAYFGTYPKFHLLRDYLNTMENMYTVGRNGMHRYNNADHSMLSAMGAVECIHSGTRSREAIWNINSEEEYHEGK